MGSGAGGLNPLTPRGYATYQVNPTQTKLPQP